MIGWPIPPPRKSTKTREEFAVERKRKVEQLREEGILRSKALIQAMLKVPREEFIPEGYRDYAYHGNSFQEEIPLPIPGENATISCPHAYPLFYEPLEIKEGDSFLEVGLGSGYGAALARELVSQKGRVVALEVDEVTYKFGKRNLERLSYDDVRTVLADGSLGYEEDSPYDRISITAVCSEFPHELVDQLKVGGRMIGETGIGFSTQAGTMSNLLYLASGYPGVDVWFVPNISGVTGDGWMANFKVAELASTKVSSYIKMFLAAFPIAVVVGFAFVQVFWSLAPIPSGRYPGAAIFWPISAITSALWIKGVGLGLFNPMWLLGGFVVGSAIYLAFSFIPAIPISFIAVAAGTGTLTPFAVTYLIGTAIAMTLRRFTGAKWWDEHKTLLSAGMMMGEGIAVSLSICVVLVINSIWVSPY